MSPVGPERHHSHCPGSNRNREEAVFEKVEVAGCRAPTAKHWLAGRGKPCCHPALSPLRSSMPVCAAHCCCVAGQCSHQCLKSTTDQDKLSHSNKLHIPAIIWPQSLTILTCSWFNVDGSTKSWLMNACTWNCNYNTASFVFAGMQIAQSAAICMRLSVKISFHITKENK